MTDQNDKLAPAGLPRKAEDPATPSLSRRQLVTGTLMGTLVGVAAPALTSCSKANNPAPTVSATASTTSGRKLIRKATVITLDPKVGTLPQADILIEDGRIVNIAPDISANDVEIIDASNMIAMPGFIDTHRHLWQGAIRHQFPNDTLNDYFGNVLAGLGPRYRPEDVRIGNLVSALSAIDAGITTILDWSHIQNTPAHTDAAIDALKTSGMRAVFGYGAPQLGAIPLDKDKNHRYPGDIKRLRQQYFSSEDQLLTLALAADGPSFGPVEPAIAEWQMANEVGARISVHIMQPQTLDALKIMQSKGLLKAETTYIHCTYLPPELWDIIKNTGASVSIASTIEMQMGHGMPAIQEALDHGIRPSLSADVETSAPNDMFTQMRSVLAVQRALVHDRAAKGDKNLPALLNAVDVLEFATVAGARANGLEHKVGTLAPGKQADLILLNKGRINVMPLKDPVGATVLGMDTSNVDSVFVAGRALKRDGKLVGVDLGAISKQAFASQDYLLSSKTSAG